MGKWCSKSAMQKFEEIFKEKRRPCSPLYAAAEDPEPDTLTRTWTETKNEEWAPRQGTRYYSIRSESVNRTSPLEFSHFTWVEIFNHAIPLENTQLKSYG